MSHVAFVGWMIIVLVTRSHVVLSDFTFAHFNTTLNPFPSVGLRLVGSAALSMCGPLNDGFSGSYISSAPSSGMITSQVTHLLTSGAGSTCTASVRVAPARPNQVGSAWYIGPQAVENGFQTKFTFQLSDRSRLCLDQRHMQHTTSAFYSRSCTSGGEEKRLSAVLDGSAGGNGIAFVLHHSRARTRAMGSAGKFMGLSGIDNGIAVSIDGFGIDGNAHVNRAFLTIWHLPPSASSGTPPSALMEALPVAVLDGQKHLAMVVYYTSVQTQWASQFRGSQSLRNFMHGNIGSLCVFMDDLTTPAVCIPLEISRAVRLNGGTAYVGFSAATGHAWQNHDVIDWSFCESTACS